MCSRLTMCAFLVYWKIKMTIRNKLPFSPPLEPIKHTVWHWWQYNKHTIIQGLFNEYIKLSYRCSNTNIPFYNSYSVCRTVATKTQSYCHMVLGQQTLFIASLIVLCTGNVLASVVFLFFIGIMQKLFIRTSPL